MRYARRHRTVHATTDLPYVLGATVRSGPEQIVRPAHLLASAALFMVILYETGRIPVETHTGTTEFGMIEAGRPFEHSGPDLAMLEWTVRGVKFRIADDGHPQTLALRLRGFQLRAAPPPDPRKVAPPFSNDAVNPYDCPFCRLAGN